LTVLLSSLLLFQVELLSAKFILPWFGGSPAVWTISLLIFQLLLLGGYGYAHVLATRARMKTQTRVHLLVVGASLLLLALHGVHWPSPITPGAQWKPTGPGDPESHVLAILVAGIGFPFFVLATTAPLVAHWSGQVDTRFSPFKFYALSNLGSILALLSYPTVIEPHIRLHVQAWIWTCGYVLFAIGIGYCALGVAKWGIEPTRSSPTHAPAASYMRWLALAACASAALLAITNVMCQDVAPVALLWAVPLSLYLISFIICFGRPRWYSRTLCHPLLGIAIILAFTARCTHSIAYQLPAYALVLFAICMTCHGELLRSKPSQAGLTSFYLTIATGGALGGCLVGLVVPQVFPDFWEFELLLWGAAALVIITVACERNSWWYSPQSWIGLALLGASVLIPWSANRLDPLIGATLHELGYYRALSCVTLAVLMVVAILACLKSRQLRVRGVQICVLAMLTLYAYVFVEFSWWRGLNAVARTRNFYGVFMVQQDESITLLIHAATYQGAQYRGRLNRLLPTLYYGYDSGIGVLLENHPKRRSTASPMRLGVVGLGAGALAAYGRRGDYLRFYEINPAILALSQGPHPLFTFLKDCPAKLDVILGDARLSMDAEVANGAAQDFDILVIDAFSGDEIPVHLLTKEAVEIYLNELSPDGVLAFHTTNASLDLKPVMAGLGREFHLAVLPLVARDRDTDGANEWVLLSRNREILDLPQLMRSGRVMAPDANAPIWTDDYSNLWQLMIAKLRQ
jgi:hypothetical protein